MATIINNRGTLDTDPIRNFRFLVQFNPLVSSVAGFNDKSFKATVGFTSVSGLAMTTEAIPYREGGYNTTVHQIPGQTTFSPITMQRGFMVGTPQNWNWMKRLFDVTGYKAVQGPVGQNFRCHVDISVLQHPAAGSSAGAVKGVGETAYSANDVVAARFRVYNAWITSLAYSDLSAGDNAIMVEQMTLAHEGFTMKVAPSAKTQAPKFDV